MDSSLSTPVDNLTANARSANDISPIERLLNVVLAVVVAVLVAWGILLDLRESREQQANIKDTDTGSGISSTAAASHEDTTSKYGSTAAEYSGSNEDAQVTSTELSMSNSTQSSREESLRLTMDTTSTTQSTTASTVNTVTPGTAGSTQQTSRAQDIRQRVKELTSSSAPHMQDISSSPGEDYYCLSSLDLGVDPEMDDHAESVLAFENFMKEHGDSHFSAKDRSEHKLDALDLADIEKQLSGKSTKKSAALTY